MFIVIPSPTSLLDQGRRHNFKSGGTDITASEAPRWRRPCSWRRHGRSKVYRKTIYRCGFNAAGVKSANWQTAARDVHSMMRPQTLDDDDVQMTSTMTTTMTSSSYSTFSIASLIGHQQQAGGHDAALVSRVISARDETVGDHPAGGSDRRGDKTSVTSPPADDEVSAADDASNNCGRSLAPRSNAFSCNYYNDNVWLSGSVVSALGIRARYSGSIPMSCHYSIG